MAIQLFMQATLMLSNYYGYTEITYADVRARTRRAGLDSLPFMAPESVRATPELTNLFNKYENDPAQLAAVIQRLGGYKNLVKYYIRTGLRASQSICRNYLLDLDEKSDYLDFIEKEVGVGYTLSTAVLALVHANSTLTTSFLAARTGLDGALGVYQDYRFLSIDREAARAVVEAAQNQYAQYFMQQVDLTSANPNLVTGGYTFSDALHAVSTIEYQCTRSGIKSLLSRSVNNSPSNLMIDPATGTITFLSTVSAPPNPSVLGGLPGGNGNTGQPGTAVPVGVTPTPRPMPTSTPTPRPTSTPRPSTDNLVTLQNDFTSTQKLIQLLQTTAGTTLPKALKEAQDNLAALKASGKDTTAQAKAIDDIQTQISKTIPDEITKAQLKLQDLQNRANVLSGTLK